ncbi:unnamed protein product [Heligmosomoides polygyrus]|uniref:Uncharacterized protein n=1 Tax=Heligmosomoides polygyrus TaxID=6339 RepID=A0A183G9Y7_HELPZ|nr:unnamed protein product [Heligmosomoides polygyrus]
MDIVSHDDAEYGAHEVGAQVALHILYGRGEQRFVSFLPAHEIQVSMSRTLSIKVIYLQTVFIFKELYTKPSQPNFLSYRLFNINWLIDWTFL